jgi:cholesterol transport system auxiliary component
MTALLPSRTAILALTLLIAGCSGAVRQPTYYSLALAPQMDAVRDPLPHPVTVAVRQFETPAYLRQGRIVYREHPEQIGFYEYHRWATDPGAMVTTAVITALQSDRVLSYVGPFDNSHRAEYLVTGRLEKLDEIDYGDGVTVEATVSAELIDVRTGAVEWTGRATHTSKVDHHDVYSVVSEMSRTVNSCLDQLVLAITQSVTGRDTAAR